jgi:hypothetical protein
MHCLLALCCLIGPLAADELFQASALSPDGKTLVLATSTALQWREVPSGKLLRSVERATVQALALSPDGLTLAAGERIIPLIDFANGKATGKLFGHTRAVRAIAFAPTGDTLISGDEGGMVRVWDLKTNKALRAFTVHPEGLSALAVAPGGNPLAVATSDGVQLYDGRTFLRTIPLRTRSNRAVRLLAFSPDGRTLATVQADGRIVLWEVATGLPRLERPTSASRVTALAFAPSGQTLIFSNDKINLWSLPANHSQSWGEHPGRDVRAIYPLANGDSALLVERNTLSHLTRKPADPAFKPMPAEEAWEALDDRDAEHAYRGLWSLVNQPAGAALAVAKMKDVEAEMRRSRQKIQRLIDDLDDDEFATRQRASEELAKLGSEVYDDLQKALQSNPPLEQHRRLEKLLRGMKRPLNPVPAGLNRRLRAVEALEYIASAEAWKVIEKLASVDEERLAETAQAALARRKARGSP